MSEKVSIAAYVEGHEVIIGFVLGIFPLSTLIPPIFPFSFLCIFFLSRYDKHKFGEIVSS
jgi:hypothetical protein